MKAAMKEYTIDTRISPEVHLAVLSRTEVNKLLALLKNEWVN